MFLIITFYLFLFSTEEPIFTELIFFEKTEKKANQQEAPWKTREKTQIYVFSLNPRKGST